MNWLRRIFGERENKSSEPTTYYDPAKFKPGEVVRICSLPELEDFAHTWKLHHKLEQEQMVCAGRTATVHASYMYHGGDIIYQLENVPGIWHERLLQAVAENDV